MGLPITERSANEMSGTDLFYTVIRRADDEYGDPYYVRLASLMSFIGQGEFGGDVTGPNSATDNSVARFNQDGQHIQGSVVIVSDAGAVSGVTSLVMAGALSGVTTLAMAGALTGVTDLSMSGALTVGDLLLYDNDESHTLALRWNENEAAANRVLNFVVGGASRTITLEGNVVISQDYSTDASPTFGGLDLNGFINWTEIAAPGNPAANDARMYAKDDGGITKPYWKDSAGTESLMLGAGVTGVTAAAVIADNTLVRGAGGDRGVQDSGWVLGDDDELTAGEELNMNNNNITRIKDFIPYDDEVNIAFASLQDCTVFVKNTGSVGFGYPSIDDHSDHLVAYWKMEETGANDRIDSVGANDLTATNTPATRAGKNNNACDFISGSSEYLSIADNADLSPTTGFAVSLWVIMDDDNVSRMIFSKGGSEGYYLYRNSDGDVVFKIEESDGGDATTSTSDQLSGSYHHIVAMACDGFVRLFINGAAVGAPAAYDDTIKDDAAIFFIGWWAGVSLYMDGGIDEVGFWNNISFVDQAAREEFVTELYNAGSGVFYIGAGTGLANLDVADFLYLSNTGLQLADTDDSHYLNLKWNENEAAANRTMNIIMGGADRSLTFEGDAIISQDYSTDATVTFGALNIATNVTWAGATGVNLALFPDNLADALSFKNANGDVFQKFISTTGDLVVDFPQHAFHLGSGTIQDWSVVLTPVLLLGLENAVYGGGGSFGMVQNGRYDDTDTRMEYITSDEASLYYQANGTHVWQTAPSGAANDPITFTTAMTIAVNGDVTPGPAGAGGNLGTAASYWNDISYKTMTDRGCLGDFTEGVEMQDESLVSCIEAIKRIEVESEKLTVYGMPRLNYSTMPKAVYKPAPMEGDEKIGEDGAETTALISIMMGAIKELEGRLLTAGI